MVIKKTKNYEQFKITEWNRAVSSSRTSAIKESIERYGYIPNPIIVNEKLEVIDGQGRLQACRELGLAIYYIVIEGIGGDECIAMNCYQKQWTQKDYIDYYSKRGNTNYIKLQKLISKYPTIPLQVITRALNKSNANVNQTIKTGDFSLTDEAIDRAKNKLDYLWSLQGHIDSSHGIHRSISYAIITLLENGLVDPKRLKDQIEKYGLQITVGTTEQAVDALQDIYNYRRKEKVFFRDAYRMVSR